jgi:hypothetical protein
VIVTHNVNDYHNRYWRIKPGGVSQWSLNRQEWCGAGHLAVGAEMVKRAGLLLAVIGAAVIGTAGSAAAGISGPAYSKEQAGYSVTGARFGVVEVNITLPDAGRFAADAGQVGFSVQLWTQHEVVDLRVYACTDASCQPGGKPADREYRLAFTRYSRSTRAVLCTTTNSSCFATPASWNRARFHAGHTVALALVFKNQYDTFEADADGYRYLGYEPSAGIVFNQARIGAEFGATPWTATPVRLPARRTAVATFGVPAGPAREAELVTYSGRSGCVSAPWYPYHRVQLTTTGSAAGRLIAGPRGLSNLGCNFTVYLRP